MWSCSCIGSVTLAKSCRSPFGEMYFIRDGWPATSSLDPSSQTRIPPRGLWVIASGPASTRCFRDSYTSCSVPRLKSLLSGVYFQICPCS